MTPRTIAASAAQVETFKQEPIKCREFMRQANEDFELMSKEGLIDYDVEETKKMRTEEEQKEAQGKNDKETLLDFR